MKRLFPSLALLAVAACAPLAPPPPAPPAAPPPVRITLSAAGFDSLPGWTRDELIQALPAMKRSCEKLLALPEDRPVSIGEALAGTAKDWHQPCQTARGLRENDTLGFRRLLEEAFTPFKVGNNETNQGLFTGYYEAEMKASRKKTNQFKVPLYGLPNDLVTVDLALFKPEWKQEQIVGRIEGNKLRPYHDRSQIESGAIEQKAPVIYWVADPVDAFMLHIQGSGRLQFDDGKTERVGFAGSNGQRFVGIGRILQDNGQIAPEDMSMQSIRRWLKANPQEAKRLMNENPRFIFFRRIDGDGPVGAQGIALTPGRSLAVDTAFIPLGVPIWLDTKTPDGKPFQRLMLAQDVGAAIKGPVRGDIFFGTGESALETAGRMKMRGEYYLLLPREAATRAALKLSQRNPGKRSGGDAKGLP